ncbi:hypothetical protein FVE85_5907 [Porphyridium purpureum]|uniref:Uncharacterized protein n=1 Tax=Porphyridium purpureum TaxID=35688 RepID=A0A5J4Z5F9_PORPP|nr:hypothetical protein FVE85_5907 [Porphyridium purpureum]|eukprot:POR3837..scf295_1
MHIKTLAGIWNSAESNILRSLCTANRRVQFGDECVWCLAKDDATCKAALQLPRWAGAHPDLIECDLEFDDLDETGAPSTRAIEKRAKESNTCSGKL